MSYTLAKNLRVNKKTGIISGDFAENNVTDWDGKHIYKHREDIYQKEDGTRSSIEKYSRFIYDVLSGNLQGSLGKYNKLAITNFYTDVEYFRREYPDKDAYVLTYNKYQNEIENELKSNPEYIIKLDNNTYLTKLNTRTYRTTWNVNQAKLFSSNDFYKIKNCFNNPIAININTREEINLKNYAKDEIPSELEKNYELKMVTDESFVSFSKKVKFLENTISSLSDKRTKSEKIKNIYGKYVNKILQNQLPGDKAIFLFGRKTEEGLPNILTIVYPELKETTRQSGEINYYVGYKFKCINLQKSLEQEYDGGGMMISYLLDDEERTKQVAFETQKDFEEDILKNERLIDEQTEEDEL